MKRKQKEADAFRGKDLRIDASPEAVMRAIVRTEPPKKKDA